MKINNNISAFYTNKYLNKANSEMEKALERISSGYRINRAADDAAGMAISTKMKTQIAALEQANRNSADAVSVIQIAEGALGEVQSMLQRTRELSVQGANDTLSVDDSAAIQAEVDQLKKEIDRVSTITEYNTKPLLDGSADRKVLSSNKKINLHYFSDEVEPQEYKVKVTQSATKATYIAPSVVQGTTCPGGSLSINGTAVVIAPGTSVDAVLDKVKNLCDTMDISLSTEGGSLLGAGSKLVLSNKSYGASYEVNLKDSDPAMLTYLGLDSEAVVTGIDAKISKEKGFSNTATVLTDGETVTITDKEGFKMKFNVGDAAVDTEVTFTLLDAGPMNIQVGTAEHQAMSIRIPKTDTSSLGIDKVSVRNQFSAEKSITKVDDAISQISAIRAKLGAYQNRLEQTMTNLEGASLNTTEALSRISDTDIAEEMTEYTQKSVLVQAASSMLAQANEKPQQVLALLQG